MTEQKTIASRLDAFFRPAFSAERLGATRVLVGLFTVVFLIVRVTHLMGYADFSAALFRPVGPVSLLTRPLVPWLARLLPPLSILAGVGFLLGWRYRITGPLFAALLLWVASYRNSFGMIFHTENLMVLHVIALGLSPRAADAHALDARGTVRTAEHDGDGRYGWPVKLATMLTLVTYFIAGEAKVRVSGGRWVWSDVLRNQVAFDNLRKLLLGSLWSPLGGWLIKVGWIWPPLAAVSVVVECGSPVALFGGKVAMLWALGAWGFHMGVLALMMIAFPYQLTGVAYASMFPVERSRLLRRIFGRLPTAAAASGLSASDDEQPSSTSADEQPSRTSEGE